MLDEIKSELGELFKSKQDAWQFLLMYLEYVHIIDDCVDEEKSVDRIEQLTKFAAIVFNSVYWRKWGTQLYITERLTHNVYFDSVVWENAEEAWKIRDSKVMNQRGYDMLFAVILIEFGEEELKKWSLKFRDYSHRAQDHHEL